MVRRFGQRWSDQTATMVRISIAAGLLLFARLSSSPAAACVPSTEINSGSIVSCGIILKPGYYQVDADIFAPSPSSCDCIVVNAPNVTLNLNNHNILGATDFVGIHVMPAAANAFIEGTGATIGKFGEGIQIDASNAIADNFNSNSNSDAGVVLSKAHKALITNFSANRNKNDGVRIFGGAQNTLQGVLQAYGNGRYGIWLDSSSHDNVGQFDAENNGVAGIYVGCSAVGPGQPCPRGSPPSSFNYLFFGIARISNNGSQQYGVAIDVGDNRNRVAYVWAGQNSIFDLFDANDRPVPCAGNFWFAEQILLNVQPQSCIR